MAQYDFDEKESTKATSTVGIMAVVIVVLLGVAAWFFYFKDDAAPMSVPPAVSSTMDGAKDAAAEVPQAMKDATTKGDQDTTRPNKDGSTGNLDQK